MASGWGLHGNVGRCYPFWKDFEECCYKYQQDSRQYCWREREDYVECLHHRKEFERVRRIQEEYDKQFKWSKKLREQEDAEAKAAAAGGGNGGDNGNGGGDTKH